MKKTLRFLFLPFLILLAVALILVFNKYHKISKPQPQPSASSIVNSNQNPTGDLLSLPIADFKSRITKKTFGMYITPQTSPVQPERFTGYHTGVDVEYTDIENDVPIYAVYDGTIVVSETANGYGGVEVLEFNFQGQTYQALYGHIRPSSLLKVGQKVKSKDSIGLLGTGYSAETDGERRHLHFSIHTGNQTDIRGYVQQKSELSEWIDPLTLYK